MTAFFEELFRYGHFYNQQNIALISGLGLPDEDRVIQLINHSIDAHQIWNARILGQQAFGVWQIHDFDALPRLDKANFEDSCAILATRNLDSLVEYSNSKGERFENSVRDILFHIVNHSTYHRGQIASLIRQHGIPPLSTDYIMFKR